jgi:hypothetical protein
MDNFVFVGTGLTVLEHDEPVDGRRRQRSRAMKQPATPPQQSSPLPGRYGRGPRTATGSAPRNSINTVSLAACSQRKQ